MHPEADALLDAIFDHPDDDTPRLVYADWLQEYGQEGYAQFIRLSVKADGRCRSLEERQQVRSARFSSWQRLPAFLSAGKPFFTIHNYRRGFPNRIEVPAEFFVRTVAQWWPVLTPPELAIYAIHGREDEVASLLGQYLPRVRKLRCDTRIAKGDHDLDRNPPMRGDFLAKLLDSGVFPKLTSLTIEIASANRTAIELLAQSDLALQLTELYVEVQFSQPNRYGVLGFTQQKREPDAVQVAILSFLGQHRELL
jgi:uncharacterized protein (TIGR02996 family)